MVMNKWNKGAINRLRDHYQGKCPCLHHSLLLVLLLEKNTIKERITELLKDEPLILLALLTDPNIKSNAAWAAIAQQIRTHFIQSIFHQSEFQKKVAAALQDYDTDQCTALINETVINSEYKRGLFHFYSMYMPKNNFFSAYQNVKTEITLNSTWSYLIRIFILWHVYINNKDNLQRRIKHLLPNQPEKQVVHNMLKYARHTHALLWIPQTNNANGSEASNIKFIFSHLPDHPDHKDKSKIIWELNYLFKHKNQPHAETIRDDLYNSLTQKPWGELSLWQLFQPKQTMLTQYNRTALNSINSLIPLSTKGLCTDVALHILEFTYGSMQSVRIAMRKYTTHLNIKSENTLAFQVYQEFAQYIAENIPKAEQCDQIVAQVETKENNPNDTNTQRKKSKRTALSLGT